MSCMLRIFDKAGYGEKKMRKADKFRVGKYYRYIFKGERRHPLWNDTMVEVLDGDWRKCIDIENDGLNLAHLSDMHEDDDQVRAWVYASDNLEDYFEEADIVWETKTGTRTALEEMENKHLVNVLRLAWNSIVREEYQVEKTTTVLKKEQYSLDYLQSIIYRALNEISRRTNFSSDQLYIFRTIQSYGKPTIGSSILNDTYGSEKIQPTDNLTNNPTDSQSITFNASRYGKSLWNIETKRFESRSEPLGYTYTVECSDEPYTPAKNREDVKKLTDELLKLECIHEESAESWKNHQEDIAKKVQEMGREIYEDRNKSVGYTFLPYTIQEKFSSNLPSFFQRFTVHTINEDFIDLKTEDEFEFMNINIPEDRDEFINLKTKE